MYTEFRALRELQHNYAYTSLHNPEGTPSQICLYRIQGPEGTPAQLDIYTTHRALRELQHNYMYATYS